MAHVLTQLKIVPKTECTEAVALAKELGLELQAKRYEKPLAEQAFIALTVDEESVWRQYCPTQYVAGGGQHVRALEQYAFDSVPIEVMRHWKAVKELYAFDRYEIWTTERTSEASDPLLVGFLGVNLYVLARWGLESPESLSVRDAAKKILSRFTLPVKWYLSREDAYPRICAAIRLSGALQEKEPAKREPNFLQRLLGMEHNA